MRRAWKCVVVLVGVVVGAFGAAQSEVALEFAARFDAVVLEEAQHPRGLRVVLLGPLGVQEQRPAMEDAVSEVLEAVASPDQRVVVVVFPKWFNTNFGGTHAAVIATRLTDQQWMAETDEWLDVARNRLGVGVRELVFEFGESYSLAYLYLFERPPTPYQPPPPRAATPSSPRNGCVSSTSASGSSMTCYSDGRVSYRSSCTNVGGRISCRSESY